MCGSKTWTLDVDGDLEQVGMLQSGCLIALYAIPLFFSASYGQKH